MEDMMQIKIHIHSPFIIIHNNASNAIPLGAHTVCTVLHINNWQAKVSRIRNIWLGPEANQRLGSWLGDFPRLHSTVKVLDEEDKT